MTDPIVPSIIPPECPRLGSFAGLNRDVSLIAPTSLIADISTERMDSIRPLFLTETLRAPATVAVVVLLRETRAAVSGGVR